MNKLILLVSTAVLSTVWLSESKADIWSHLGIDYDFPDCVKTSSGYASVYDVPIGNNCTSCPAGWYLYNTQCNPCPPGYYCEGGQINKTKACDSSSYSDVAGAVDFASTNCKSCPEGYSGYLEYCSSNEVMTSCPQGQYLDNGHCRTCYAGQFCPGGTEGSQSCGYGYYCPAGTTEKIPCPAGTSTGWYDKLRDSSGCQSCPDGQVSTEGSQNCRSSCPAGTVQDGKACIPLPGCLNFNNGVCTECDSGYLTNSEGTCTPIADCKNGLHQTADGACATNDDENCNTQEGDKCTECKGGYLEQGGGCVTSCGAGYKQMENWCNRIQYTPAEAAPLLNDDNNTVTITFRK